MFFLSARWWAEPRNSRDLNVMWRHQNRADLSLNLSSSIHIISIKSEAMNRACSMNGVEV
jgi:hypothetical protein